MRNNASCKIVGVGIIKVKMFDGVVRTLSDVRHVLEVKRKLISLSTLDSKEYRYTAESGVLKISKGFLVVMKGQRNTAKLYVFVASSSLSDDDITKLWHMRLGHMSENGMGPSRVPSRGEANYMLTFINDFSRKVWAFFLKQKSDLVLCKSAGIVRRLTVRHTPQQNSIAERMNRTIMEKVRCMLSNANLPKSFWAEAASTACFLINRSPSVAIEKKTPQEVWSGNPANYSDLKIFECPTYAHIDNGKLEPRSIKCVFLGYKAGIKGVASSPQYSIAKNKTRREIKPLKKYAEADLVAYALNVAEDIDANRETWDLVKLLKGKKVVRCKWIFKKKEGTPGVEEPRYKARLVTKDYSQIPGVDFTDAFSPVVKHSSIRALLGIVAMHDLELE
ncbi:hypothetical protein CXB51_009769 [Gossypium anomalum]|uniref:Integrase catalytic domain-containing protein n=1 Tax=Gossypium anomalum TaxID=47600 RepID=A0A8J5Z7X4_9ROSI|nr:hypothetical protein CXB51_009769 [Gossypium anomalum]